MLVSELALGAMIFGESSQRSASPQDAERMIHRFLDAGGNHIDTADVYAGGRSEEIVGKAIAPRRDRVVLASKVRFPTEEGPNAAGLARVHVLRGVENSLRRLNVETIDLLYAHAWDPLTPLEETLRAFEQLISSGKVRYLGVSNFKAWQVMKGLAISAAHDWPPFIAAQYQYSLVVRDIEDEYQDLCLSEGLGLVPWGPLGGGFLTGKYRSGEQPQDPESGRLAVTPESYEEAWSRRATQRNWHVLAVMDQIVAAHPGVTHSQVALAWLLSRPVVTSVIIGVRTVEQLEDNLGASELRLSADELQQLDNASQPEQGYPYRMIRSNDAARLGDLGG